MCLASVLILKKEFVVEGDTRRKCRAQFCTIRARIVSAGDYPSLTSVFTCLRECLPSEDGRFRIRQIV
jgi:hypothetical protein